MEEKKRRGRRDYLNSFQKDSSGNFVYEGEYYVFDGTKPELRRALAKLWALCLVLLAALLAAGCVDGPGTGNCFYVLLPYAVSLIAGIRTCWALGRLTAGGNPMREYVYQASVEKIPGCAVFTAVCAGAAAAGELVYLFRNGAGGKLPGGCAFLFLEGIAFILALMVRRGSYGIKWLK
ncbi:MAG: hypothetical protein Q4F29_07015 [Lachnospiraceae bacterium]|nr:hypothetical protein [Lachnospiraceae bacterium]